MKSPRAPGQVPENGMNAKKPGWSPRLMNGSTSSPSAAQDLVEALGLVRRRAAEPGCHLVRGRASKRRDRRVAQPLDEQSTAR